MTFVSTWLAKHRKPKPHRPRHPRYATEAELQRAVRHTKEETQHAVDKLNAELGQSLGSLDGQLTKRIERLEDAVAELQVEFKTLQDEVVALQALIS